MWTEEDTKNKYYLNYLLRQSAEIQDLEMSSDGYVSLDAILNLPHTKEHYNLSVDIIKDLIKKSDIKRFELKEEEGKFYIRALQRQSIIGPDQGMIFNREITDADEFPLVVYSTYVDRWEMIKNEGIRPTEGNNHMHFSTQHPDPGHEFEIMIEIDLEQALNDGMIFYECLNGLIATTGFDGKLAPKYFKATAKEEKEIEEVVAETFEEQEDWEEIVNADDHPVVIFRTSLAKWSSIRTQGITLKDEGSIILLRAGYSEFDNKYEVIMEIDLEKALIDGIKFYQCSPKILASPGDNGIIDPKYFKNLKILDRTNERRKTSKYLVVLLRHQAHKYGLEMSPDGFVLLDSILNLPESKRHNLAQETIYDLVEEFNRNLKRFELKEEEGKLFIRAVYAHSVKGLDFGKIMKEVTDADNYPTVVYGTSELEWKVMQYRGIKSKGQRNHIHLSVGYPKKGQIVPFMQIPSEVYVEIDVKLAMSDGMKFYITANENVIATPGLNGVIDKKYFKVVKNRTEQVAKLLQDTKI